MKREVTGKSTRMSAAERREDILQAAMTEFAVSGLQGTSTEKIADRVGVSQPYLFRLFGTKKDLFLAAVERGFDRVENCFIEAAGREPDDALRAMGAAYIAMLPQREYLLLQLQSYAACADPDVVVVVQRRFGRLFTLVQELSGATPDEVREFFAHGMLLTVAASIKLPDVHEKWARQCLGAKV